MNNKDLQAFKGFSGIRGKAELAERLFDELARYSVSDLQAISANLEKDINALPSPYRERVRPYFLDQYFRRYGNIMALRQPGHFLKLHGDIKDISLFRDFCRTVAEFRPLPPQDADDGSPFFGHFYFVVSAFYMFVLDEPGHPVGMPFPGGFKVDKRQDGYYCPIRDKEKDVIYSICNFCPAKQSEVP